MQAYLGPHLHFPGQRADAGTQYDGVREREKEKEREGEMHKKKKKTSRVGASLPTAAAVPARVSQPVCPAQSPGGCSNLAGRWSAILKVMWMQMRG